MDGENDLKTRLISSPRQKACEMEDMAQVMKKVVQKSSRGLCQLACNPLKSLCSPAQTHQHVEDKTTQAVGLLSSPSNVLILNISNATLIHCVIGNHNTAVVENQPGLQEAESQVHEKTRCSCRFGQEGAAQAVRLPPPPSAETRSITIHRSHLQCVVIGNNNHMHMEQTQLTDADD